MEHKPPRHASESRHPELEARLAAIETRNQRVENDKAWETSMTRRAFISLITYLTASLFLYAILVPDWYLGACVPVLGYWLSTLSLPPLKTWWIDHNP